MARRPRQLSLPAPRTWGGCIAIAVAALTRDRARHAEESLVVPERLYPRRTTSAPRYLTAGANGQSNPRFALRHWLLRIGSLSSSR